MNLSKYYELLRDHEPLKSGDIRVTASQLCALPAEGVKYAPVRFITLHASFTIRPIVFSTIETSKGFPILEEGFKFVETAKEVHLSDAVKLEGT